MDIPLATPEPEPLACPNSGARYTLVRAEAQGQPLRLCGSSQGHGPERAGSDRLQLNSKMFSLVMQNMLPGLKVFPRSSIVPTSLTIKEILYKWNA